MRAKYEAREAAWWQHVFDAVRDPIFLHDENFCIVDANVAYSEQAGLSVAELRGRPYWEVFPRQTGPLHACLCALHNHQEEQEEISLADGTTWLSRSFPITRTEGEECLSVHLLENITLRKQAENKLHIAAEVFEATQEGMMITDGRGVIQMVNRAFTEITGYDATEAIGKNPSLLKSGRQDALFYQGFWTSLKSTGRWQGEVWDRRKNGSIYPEWLSVCVLRSNRLNRENDLHYLAIFSDISAHKQSQQDLEYIAYHDTLTNLPNRHSFCLHLEQILARADPNQIPAVLFLDLDHFKPVNDTFGHEMGNHLLKAVANRFLGCVRKQDMLARYGGDEFVLVVCDNSSRLNLSAVVLAERLTTCLETPFLLDNGDTHRLGVSVGISLYPQHGKQAEELIHCADLAMFQAKQSGGNRFRFYRATPPVIQSKPVSLAY